MSYSILREAILSKKQVTCTFRGHYRELCPHVLGLGKDGNQQVLSFQFGGQSSSRLPPGGEWRCMPVAEMQSVQMREGPWLSGESHKRPQTCVKDVDVEVSI